MPAAINVEFNELDLTFSVGSILLGISGVMGITQSGKYATPDTIINNWGQYQTLFGSFLGNSQFPLLCYRALNKGAALRISRVGHYTDPTDRTTLTAVTAGENNSYLFTLSAAMVASNVATINFASLTKTVTYATSSDNTVQLICNSLLQYWPGIINKAVPVKLPAAPNALGILIVIDPAYTSAFNPTIVITLGASQPTWTLGAGIPKVTDQYGNPLFSLPPVYPGADANNLRFAVLPASNGNTNYFNIQITHLTNTWVNELYENLTIPGYPTAGNSTYLQLIANNSSYLQPTYYDLSALPQVAAALPINPFQANYGFINGSDGGAVVAADYIGDSSAQTGFNAFDQYDDMMQICAPEISELLAGVHAAGSAYASNRKDLMYWGHLDNTNNTAALLLTAMSGLALDSNYSAFYAGGLKINDPVSNLPITISELGDVLALAANSDNWQPSSEGGPWRSFAGPERGVITGTTGVVNNFGGRGQFSDLNNLSNARINMVIVRNNLTTLWGNFTAQVASSETSFVSIRRLLIYLEKSLRPTVETYLQQPNDPTIWENLYLQVQPFLQSLSDKGALLKTAQDPGYLWQGDQGITDPTKWVVNNPTDVSNGKYKVQLFVKPVNAINTIEVTIVRTLAGVSFTTASNSVGP